MSREEWRCLWNYLRETAAREKKSMLEVAVSGAAEAVLPFIGIMGMGTILDGIYGGADRGALFQYAGLLLAGMLLCRLAGAWAYESFKRKIDYTKDLEAMELNRQAFSIDYEYLEDIHVQELRSRAMAKSALGIRGWFLWMLRFAVKYVAAALTAFFILFPMLQRGSQTENWFVLLGADIGLFLIIGGMIWANSRMAAALTAFFILFPMLQRGSQTENWFVLLGADIGLFLIIGGMIWANSRIGFQCTRQAMASYNTLDEAFHRRRYFTDLLSGAESQKDLRIGRQQEEINREIDRVGRRIQEGERERSRLYIRRGGVTVLMAELSGLLIYLQQEEINREIDRVGRRIQEGERERSRLYIRRGGVTVLMAELSGLLIYLFTAFRSSMELISIGEVVRYASSVIQLVWAVTYLAASMGNLKQMASYAADYQEYMGLEARKYRGTIPVEKRRDNRFQVSFEHVSFKYPGSAEYALKDLTLSFEIGGRMALVGRNGSGKSTFIKLLCRLYDVTEGCIKVNGIDIRMYNNQEYCDLFGIVFQDYSIFAFPVGENIAASEEAEGERVLEALEKAGLVERFTCLRDGLKTCVGKEFSEDGVAFSGGEKQKMAIARAIYRNAPFVIMDEPTAALDPVAECQVYAGFDRMVGGRTALYISHRLASCRFCEDILVFDQGVVVQRGSHEELKKQDGIYRELWEAQAQYYG